jgi:flagellar biosynthetic protein FlhB
MTRQEVKEEQRTYDGDPYVRSRLRSRMREIMTRDMLQRVPQADVVITNPTHFAVALEYRQNAMEAPQVTAKGEDEIAFRIRRIAEQHGVPLVENKPLARALYANTEPGDIIPEAYYQLVAEILIKVAAINEERRKAQALGA